MSLAEIRTRQRIATLYQQGLLHYNRREWQEADSCFTQVVETDPNYQDIASLYVNAHRRARWAGSLLGRVGHKLTSWMKTSEAEKLSETAHEGE